jgi:hypothetical protein
MAHARRVPHRDQAEAMRARIDALERRLKDTKREAADERERLEAALAEARGEASRRPSSEPPAKTGGGRWPVALAIGGLLSLAAGWFLLVSLAFPSARITDLRVVTRDGRDALFVSEVVSHVTDDDDIETSRLAVYDLATGERRSRRVVQWMRGGGVVVLGPASDGVWAYQYGSGVVLLDPDDGRVLRRTEDLLTEAQREQLLLSVELDQRLGYLAGERAVVVTLRDGSRLALTGEGTREYTGQLPSIPTPPRPWAVTVTALGGGDVLRLEARAGEDRYARRLHPSGARLLHGTFVVDSAGQPIVLSDPPSVLVEHAESLESDADSVLSRVALEGGEALWTTPLQERVRVRLAHAAADAVVLVTVSGELMAFGLERGDPRYRVSL